MKLKRHHLKYINSSVQDPRLKYGVGLLARDGNVYPGYVYKDGVAIHPPVTNHDSSEIDILVKWCRDNKLKTDLTNNYYMTVIESAVIAGLLDGVDLINKAYVEDVTTFQVEEALVNYLVEKFAGYSDEELYDAEDRLDENINKLTEKLVNWYVSSFVRIRVGGKYAFRGEDIVYFRISSQGYDWTSTIKHYLEEEFGVDSEQEVWVGLDLDNRGSDKRYYEGTIKNLFLENLEHEVWASKLPSPSRRKWL